MIIKKVVSLRSVSSFYSKTLIINKIFNKSSFTFCNLPKPSRFAQELGLHKQFQNVSNKAKEQQKTTSRTYQYLIWVAICVMGSYFLAGMVNDQITKKYQLFWHFVKLKIKLIESQEQKQVILKQIIEFLNKFYKNRPFDNEIIGFLIREIQQSYCRGGKLGEQKQMELLVNTLQKNLNNDYNKGNSFYLYKKYLESVYLNKIYLKGVSNSKILHHLLKNGDVQVLYIIALLKNSRLVDINPKSTQNIHSKIAKIKQQITQKQNRFKQFPQDLLTQPYQYQVKLEKAWIDYILNTF